MKTNLDIFLFMLDCKIKNSLASRLDFKKQIELYKVMSKEQQKIESLVSEFNE